MNIEEKLKELENAKYKLLLIVGAPGTGKSKLIQQYSEDTGTPILNLNTIFGEEATAETGEQITKTMNDFIANYNKEVILLDNKRVLYSKNSTIDLLAFLKDISTKKTVIATWNGMIQNGNLVHIRSKLPEDLSYPIEDVECAYIICK